MKYHTIGTSSSMANEKKSSLKIYADMDISLNKMYSESEVNSIRGELEIVQKALRLQTKRCRHLVAEFTRRLQEKEHQYISEKALRDDQLAKVLRALLIFEARLRQEQKYITRQLNEKDLVIKKQNSDIKRLLVNQYCKNCRQYYNSSPLQESLGSSTEFVLTDGQDYQSSNFESLDSSSETCGTLSEKEFNKSESSVESNSKDTETKNVYQKNPNSLGRRTKKIPHRKSIGTYFEVLKMRNGNSSPMSNEDNTSNDYDHLDSLPTETVDNKIIRVTENIEQMFEETHEMVSVNNEEKIPVKNSSKTENTKRDVKNNEKIENKQSQITESIPVFEGGDETNDNWYASASDQEDDVHRDIYRNNPVLECMNQILFQNINDTLNSPPKTPNIDRRPTKNNKKVKFSDEEVQDNSLTQKNLKENEDVAQDYYETPIQNSPNFYETPQSIYSNDYEQILSKCSETFTKPEKDVPVPKPAQNHHYLEMEEKKNVDNENRVIKKTKILRTPPALPPKPVNLVSKYKLQILPKAPPSEKSNDGEPDYCSISELNLPQNKNAFSKKINVVAEINAPTSLDIINKLNANDIVKTPDKTSENCESNIADNMVVKKCIDKMNIQVAKQTPIKCEPTSPKKKETIEIPKLPQVSEILIPESEDEEKEKEVRINQDNYMRNNTQVLKLKTPSKESPIRKPIAIGSSVSSLISSFNNNQILNEVKYSPEKNKTSKTLFSSFENLQNLEKRTTPVDEVKIPNFEKFDLSQNFEEFKLDDCEIEEYTVEEIKTENEQDDNSEVLSEKSLQKTAACRVDVVRAAAPNDEVTPTLNKSAIELFKKQLEMQHKAQAQNNRNIKGVSMLRPNEPTYEHFLECTGLSTKSLLSSSGMLTNHKTMMKPKDVKLRSKVKGNNLFERHSTSNVKYWSEPYI